MQMQQQKLGIRNTYTPTDAPQVCSPVTNALNREETLSEHSLKTVSTNPDVAQQSGRTGHNHYVYVLNMHSQPIMPCSCGKARRLLKQEKAKVVKRSPFTIQLLDTIGTSKQPITLGIDTGAKDIGFSCITKKDELFGGELKLDDKMSKRLVDRAMYRRNKRNRLWHRKPRFLNRAKKEGWLPPSIERKYQTHLKMIKMCNEILPITKTNIETAKFDIQKMEYPDIEGTDYQKGRLYGYTNIRSYIIAREKGKCQLCGKEWNEKGWNIHHVKERKNGGSNKPDNLALLHIDCHKKLHKENLNHKLSKSKSFKESTFMNIIRKRFWNDVKDMSVTYGYKTMVDRQEIGLQKSHHNDAFIIAGGINQKRYRQYQFNQKRKNNRCLQLNRKGYKPSIRRCRYNFQPNDLVRVKDKIQRIKGMFSYGRYIKLEDGYCKPSDIEFHFSEKTIYEGLVEC